MRFSICVQSSLYKNINILHTAEHSIVFCVFCNACCVCGGIMNNVQLNVDYFTFLIYLLCSLFYGQ